MELVVLARLVVAEVVADDEQRAARSDGIEHRPASRQPRVA